MCTKRLRARKGHKLQLGKIQSNIQRGHTMKKGDTVYVLDDYRWANGKVKTTPREGSKSVLIEFPASFGLCQREKRVPIDKIALPAESVCVVWETWKGTNGRGGYRVEREMYPNERVLANQVSRDAIGTSGRVTEEQKP